MIQNLYLKYYYHNVKLKTFTIFAIESDPSIVIECGNIDDAGKCMECSCFCSTNARDHGHMNVPKCVERLQNLLAINGNFEGLNVVSNIIKSKMIYKW